MKVIWVDGFYGVFFQEVWSPWCRGLILLSCDPRADWEPKCDHLRLNQLPLLFIFHLKSCCFHLTSHCRERNEQLNVFWKTRLKEEHQWIDRFYFQLQVKKCLKQGKSSIILCRHWVLLQHRVPFQSHCIIITLWCAAVSRLCLCLVYHMHPYNLPVSVPPHTSMNRFNML